MRLEKKILEAILDSRDNLDSVPSIVIEAVVVRTLDSLKDLLPLTESADYDCKVEDLFEDWTICACGRLVQSARAVIIEEHPLCLECYHERKNGQEQGTDSGG